MSSSVATARAVRAHTTKKEGFQPVHKQPKKQSDLKTYILSIGAGSVLSQYVDNEALQILVNAVVSVVTVWVTKKAISNGKK